MPNLNDIFNSAQSDGSVSQESFQILCGNDLSTQINQAMGVPVDQVVANEVVLVTLLIDDSGSIRFIQGNTEAIRKGHNLIRDEVLGQSKSSAGVLMHTRYLNTGVLYPYVPLDQVPDMTSKNYNPGGGTPLYDAMLVTLGSVVAKSQEFQDAGVACRTITAVFTDGGDTSSLAKPGEIASIVTDMIKSEIHIVIAVGVDDGSTDYSAVFKACGVHPEWILTPGNTPSEYRKAFGVVSKSTKIMSQTGMTAADFSSSVGNVKSFEWE